MRKRLSKLPRSIFHGTFEGTLHIRGIVTHRTWAMYVIRKEGLGYYKKDVFIDTDIIDHLHEI